MTINKLRPHLDKFLLGSIFVALSTSTILWTIHDRTPPSWDPSDHIKNSYDYYRMLAHADFRGFATELFVAPHFYAPFVHLVSAGVFLVLGASKLTGIIVNLLSLGALLLATSWLSRYLYAKKQVAIEGSDTAIQPSVFLGVLPALIAACYHFSAWLMHDAFLDFPLTAAVTVGFALLVRADDFRVRRYALAFGLAAGIGLLVKQTFAFFFVLPAVYVVIRVLLTRDRQAYKNLALAMLVLILVASIWYAPHLGDVIAIYRENRLAAVNENEASLFTFHSNFYYVHALISMQMQGPLAMIFAVGLVYSLVRCRKQNMILYLWILSGLACFALIANKDVRYTVPVLPAAALISVCWLREFKPRDANVKAKVLIRKAAGVLKVVLIAAIAGWALVSFYNAQWPAPGFGTAIDSPRYRWMVFSRNYYGLDHRPLDNDWSVPEIVRFIANQQSTSPPVLGVVVNMPYLNPSSVALYARLLADKRAAPPIIGVKWVIDTSLIYRIEECDYVLVRTGLDRKEWVTTAEREVEQIIRDNPDQFTRAASFPVPMEGTEAIVYRYERR